MLLELKIKNFAIISDLTFIPENGLNVITGETGAGKSIIFDALNISLGARSNKDILKDKNSNAYLESVFSIDKTQKEIYNLMFNQNLDEDTLIFSKEIRPSGVGLSKINDRNFTQGNIQKYSENVIHIYGQHEQLDLLDEKKHIKLLDKFGDDKFRTLLGDYRKIFNDYNTLRSKLNEFNLDEEELKRELDFYKFQVEEIDEASIMNNEDELLESEEKKLSNIKNLEEMAATAQNLLEGGEYEETGIIGLLNSLSTTIEKINSSDSETSSWLERVNGLYYEAYELKKDISYYFSNLSPDEERLYEIRERLNVINKLKIKYGKTLEEIQSYRDEVNIKLSELLNYNESKDKLLKKIEGKKSELMNSAQEISLLRKDISKKLSIKLEKELKELNMPYAKFMVDINESDFSEEGIDNVRFMISTNKNQDMKPLAKIVSGGEMSRIMLGLRTLISERDNNITLIFDEIDSGISGDAVIAVGKKLKDLAKFNQVIVISHLPQIAAMADVHFLIKKHSDEEEVYSSLIKLDREQRIKEIAHLLSGESLTALKHAEEMIDKFKGGNN